MPGELRSRYKALTVLPTTSTFLQEVLQAGAAAPCSPGEARGGAGRAPAAHKHSTEQISTCSHEGAHRAAVDEAWRRHSPWIPLQEQPQARAAACEEEPMVGQEGWGSCCLRSCAGAVLEGGPHEAELCWSSDGRAAACGKSAQDQFRKVCIPWEGATWSRVTMEER